jgi:hypothetical protein
MVHRRCAGPPRHTRFPYAVERREWLGDVDSLFRLNGVALLAPYPVEE